jgi:hypothetical protein
MKGYSPGDRVLQAQYGVGTITAVDEYHTIIYFDDHGSRTFSTSLVRLERSATPAPVKPARAPRKKKVVAVAATTTTA